MTFYRCRVCGHLAHDYPTTSNPSTSDGSTGPTRESSSKSGRTGLGQSKRRGQHVHFGGMNVLYDYEWYEYSVDDYEQIYVILEAEPTDAGVSKEEKEEETKA